MLGLCCQEFHFVQKPMQYIRNARNHCKSSLHEGFWDFSEWLQIVSIVQSWIVASQTDCSARPTRHKLKWELAMKHSTGNWLQDTLAKHLTIHLEATTLSITHATYNPILLSFQALPKPRVPKNLLPPKSLGPKSCLCPKPPEVSIFPAVPEEETLPWRDQLLQVSREKKTADFRWGHFFFLWGGDWLEEMKKQRFA